MDALGRTALSIASENGDVEAVVALLSTRSNVVDQADRFGQTALHLASRRGHDRVVRLLLEAGASVNAKTCIFATPLMYADTFEHEHVKDTLLNNGAGMYWLSGAYPERPFRDVRFARPSNVYM